MGDDAIRDLELASSQHLAAALLLIFPSGAATYISGRDRDRRSRLDEALRTKGWR